MGPHTWGDEEGEERFCGSSASKTVVAPELLFTLCWWCSFSFFSPSNSITKVTNCQIKIGAKVLYHKNRVTNKSSKDPLRIPYYCWKQKSSSNIVTEIRFSQMEQISTILCYFFHHLFPPNHILEETCFISSNIDEITLDVILIRYFFSWFMLCVCFQSNFKFSNDSFKVKKRKRTLFYVGESVS